jgi:hypothetical protein
MPTIPQLTRSVLQRSLQPHGISRLPDVEGDKSKRWKFKRYLIGFFHMDIGEGQAARGKLYLYADTDRTSKFRVAQLVATDDRTTARKFLQHMLGVVPYQVHTIPTHNGNHCAEQPWNRNSIYSRPMRVDMICDANGIEHRPTKCNHPWTNCQIARTKRKIKHATVERYHYEDYAHPRTHLTDFLDAYNFVRRLKMQNDLAPYGYSCKIWTTKRDLFELNRIDQMP